MRMGMGLGLGAQRGVGSSDMILVYAIPAPSTNIQLAIQANSTWFSAGQSVVIDWGDGSAKETVSATSGQSGYIGHTYTSPVTYTILISGSMTMYGRSGTDGLSGQEFLTHIHSFGKLGITSLVAAFNSCSGLVSAPKTLPDSVTNMLRMFRNCSGDVFNPDVSSWNVSKVTNMSYMFYNCSGSAFNPDVSNWNMSNMTNMSSMFRNCSHLNFRGGRGVNGLGIGIAKWTPKSLLTGAGTGLSDFMLNTRAQDATYLDSILTAWAALIGDPVNPLPTKITCHFGTTKYTSAGADSFALLTAPISSGGAEWTITSGGLQA